MADSNEATSSSMVVLGDVDAAGVLYFASVFRWHERVFTEWLSSIAWPLHELLDSGRGLPIRSSWADYPSSARLGETLKVVVSVHDVKGTEFVFRTRWTSAAGRVVSEVSTLHVACERETESGYFVRTSIWGGLRDALASLDSD